MRSPTPLALTDDQLNAISAAATPLPPDLRPVFLETCAREIAAMPTTTVGDGSLHRLIMTIQRQYYRPPLGTEEQNDRGGRRSGVGKYA